MATERANQEGVAGVEVVSRVEWIGESNVGGAPFTWHKQVYGQNKTTNTLQAAQMHSNTPHNVPKAQWRIESNGGASFIDHKLVYVK